MGPPPAVALAQTAVQMKSDKAEESAKLIVSEAALGAAQTDRPTSMQSVQASAVPSAAPETARHVANQIAVAITNTTGKTTEISLNPEELGRVRLSLSVSDGAITLNVLAERAETQDLLRRHMDQLAQEFRALGYSSIEFSFGDQSQKPHEEKPLRTDTTESDKQEEVPTNDIVSKRATVGLDLRI
jgi:flagellar hook-length control protein FliK